MAEYKYFTIYIASITSFLNKLVENQYIWKKNKVSLFP